MRNSMRGSIEELLDPVWIAEHMPGGPLAPDAALIHLGADAMACAVIRGMDDALSVGVDEFEKLFFVRQILSSLKMNVAIAREMVMAMSEPTIEEVVSMDYWIGQIPVSVGGITAGRAIGARHALRAVLRELDAASEKDMHFIDDLKDRIRAALGET